MERTHLLRRIETSGARIVALIAPPGYGRTSLAQCAGAEGLRIVYDFQTEIAGLGEVLVAIERELALASTGPVTIVLDNLDTLEREGDDFGLLLTCIANAPQRARFIVCSLSAPEFLGRFPPHEVLLFDADDLRFTADECTEVFAGIDGATELVPTILALTLGWPVAVLMLVRYAREQDVRSALTRSNDLIDALTGYLVANVFSVLHPDCLEDLLRAAVIPDACSADLSDADGALPPFVQTQGATLTMHPLVRAAVVRRYASRCAIIVSDAADNAKREGNWERAAAFAIQAGDAAGAAAALDAMDAFILTEPSKTYRALFRRIDSLYLTAYPNLWASTVRMRRFITSPTTLVFEAKTVWASMSPETPPLVRVAVACAYAQVLADTGHDVAAIELLEGEQWLADAMPMVNLTIARIFNVAGRFSEGHQRWTEAVRHGGSGLLTRWFIVLYELPIARARGEIEEERVLSERAIALGEQSDEPMMLLYALAETSFGAWLAGDEVRHAACLERLHAALRVHDNATFHAFEDAVQGRRPKVLPQMPAWRARADLVRCTFSADVESGALAARDALNASREASNAFLIVLSAVAVATLTPSLRSVMLHEAKAAAEQIESAPLMAAIAAFERHETERHMLTPFVERLQLLTAQDADALTLNYFRGAITWRGSVQAISHLGLALVFALGTAPQRKREELYDMLWPSLNEKAAATALRMCVYRVRNQLHEGPVIVATRDGYALDGAAVRDMPLLESALNRARSDLPLDASLRDRLTAALHDIYAGRPQSLTAYEWWEPIEASIARFAETIAMRLALDAILRGEFDEALTVGTTLLAHDACSETGCEILVRTNLARGDRDGAESSVRAYERSLKSELDVDAAPRLRTLLIAT